MEGKFTPDYEHFLRNPTLRHNVYEPEADTFLFLDGIDAEVEPILARLIGRLRDRAWAALSAQPPTSLPPPSQASTEEGPSPSSSASASPPLPSSSSDAVPPRPAPFSAVEIGCGSGLVITHLGMTLQRALVGWSRGALRAANEAEAAAAAAAVAQQSNAGGNVDAAMHHLPPPPPIEDIVIARSIMAAVHGFASDSSPNASSLPLLAPPFADFYFVDINPLALKAASETWGINLSAQMRVLRGLTGGDAKQEREGEEGNPLAPVTMLTEGGEPAAFASVQKHLAAVSRVPNCVDGAAAATLPVSLFSCVGIHGSLFAPFLPSAAAAAANTAELSAESAALLPSLVSFDIALFNPPYVPTDQEELDKATAEHDILTAAWCGGPRGRVVVDKFLQQVFSVLRPLQTVVVTEEKEEGGEGTFRVAHPPLHALSPASGLLYIVAIRENDVDDLCAFTNDCFCDADEARVAAERAALTCSAPPKSPIAVLGAALTTATVAERWTGEHLSILKFEMVPEALEDALFDSE